MHHARCYASLKNAVKAVRAKQVPGRALLATPGSRTISPATAETVSFEPYFKTGETESASVLMKWFRYRTASGKFGTLARHFSGEI